ncbi:MAG: tRNA preQ1(34) S-adenosylmethionine ribosyltransferase-isomerase QueA [Patescibacteria group bacterium]
MNAFRREIARFNYLVPSELIAQKPARPRDSARLLVFNRATGAVSLDTFAHLDAYLPKHAVLVFNKTKVIPARLELQKETGGRVKIVYLSHQGPRVRCLADRPLVLGSKLFFKKKYIAQVKAREGGEWVFEFRMTALRVIPFFEKHGTMPIPPYIKQSPLSGRELKSEYQTVFAETKGSVAAPTASLHFTKRLIARLKRQGFHIEYVTLHVGRGTFASLTEEQWHKGELHGEYFYIEARTQKRLNEAKKSKRQIVAIGTTVTRTLESATDARGNITKLSGTTRMFIREHDKMRFVDALVTNFHVPRSSLMMLVSAFVGRKKLLELYQMAIKAKFRLFSFGDGMLVR